MKNQIPVVISVGGSIVVPKIGIDVSYLLKFKELINRAVKAGERFIIIVGGGYTAREYQGAASKIVKLAAEDLDWLGIHATRLNGHLMRTIFRDIALQRVIKDPTRSIKWSESVLIAAGWKPGWSTDYVAVRLAHKFGAKRVINLTNIDAVYDKDPSRFDDAIAYDRIAWKDFRKIVGSKWVPGANAPFDPIASRLAHKWGLTVAIANGRDLKNMQNIIDGQKFRGTVIE